MKSEVVNFSDSRCIDFIKNEGVLAFPTETVFGLGVIYDSKKAFDRLCNLKNRVPDKPFTVMVSSKKDISIFVDLNEKMERLIDKFMPGEITILFPAKKDLFPWITLNHPTVGIRISASKEVRDLIDKVGKPLLVTSSNMAGEKAHVDVSDVIKIFGEKIPFIIDGNCLSNIPSTIVLINKDEIKLIRQGAISFEEIEKEWEK